jgi:shikimate dehydrogenase
MSIDQYGVFGHPINHSKSPRIHTLFAEQTRQQLQYSAEDVPAETFTEAINRFFANGGKGLNCTVPLKELAWRRADRLTDRAQSSKAVNTLVWQADGSLLGDNTDGVGLVTDLTQNHGLDLKNLRILILGAGGASRGIIGPIQEQFPEHVVIANRTVSKAEQLASEFAHGGKINGCGFDQLLTQQFDLIINATSASLSNELPPLPDQLLINQGICYDLAYANKATPFVSWGHSHHAAKSVDGLGMLVEQAAEAFFLWRRVRPKTRAIIDLLDQERQSQ